MRKIGILMPVFSLPSPYGIGTFGKNAYKFADYLKNSGVAVWQSLPLGPTGYMDSPYQSFSTFAGNTYFIDPDMLVRDGFLLRADLPPRIPEGEPIDYGALYVTRAKMLKAAFDYSYGRVKNEVAEFESTHPDIADYALFMAIKEKYHGKSRLDFPKSIRLFRKAAIDKCREKLADKTEYYLFTQYLFFSQWKALRGYVNSLGIKILGDLPIYVAQDSSDVWANYRSFQLDENRRPCLVAGVPPDYFSENGQKWGNPLYNWDYIKNHRYDFWVRRMSAAAEMFDIVRLDHFIGFANYYCVQPDAPDAKDGFWRDGPGIGLFRAIKAAVPQLSLVAEDLGVVSDKVKRLLKKSGFPSMRVLQFAFGGGSDNPHLPENIGENMIVYTGTHDNAPTKAWWQSLSETEKAGVRTQLGVKTVKMPETLIRAAFASRADTAVIPMWDVLGLGNEARVNTPGVPVGNWRWRLKAVPRGKAVRNGK